MRFEQTEEGAAALGARFAAELLEERCDLQGGEEAEGDAEGGLLAPGLGVLAELDGADGLGGLGADAVDGGEVELLFGDAVVRHVEHPDGGGE